MLLINVFASLAASFSHFPRLCTSSTNAKCMCVFMWCGGDQIKQLEVISLNGKTDDMLTQMFPGASRSP